MDTLAAVPVPDDLIRFWRTLDGVVSGAVEPAWWGAVVCDRRFPAVTDANYARVDERADPTLDEVEEAMRPALDRVGLATLHVVAFRPEAATGLVAEMSQRAALTWDLVMRHGGQVEGVAALQIEDLEPGPELWAAVDRSLALFEIEDPSVREQILAIERDVLGSSGCKRWFGVRESGAIVALAALVELEGIAYIDNVATEPRARGRGYASALGAHAVAAAARESEPTYLLADPGGPLKMYERLGFREVARFPSMRTPLTRASA